MRKVANLVFGFRDLNLEASRSLVERQLGICFRLHNSIYRGGDYYRAEVGDELFFICLNCNVDGTLEYPDNSEFDVFLLVEETERADYIKEVLAERGAALIDYEPWELDH